MSHTYANRMSDLAESFPGLQGRAGVRPWDIEAFILDMPGMSHGERCAARFVLGVWNGCDWLELAEELAARSKLEIAECLVALQPFDFFEAWNVWDTRHCAAFLAWAREPFHP